MLIDNLGTQFETSSVASQNLNVKRGDLIELKSLNNPPEAVKKVFEIGLLCLSLSNEKGLDW